MNIKKIVVFDFDGVLVDTFKITLEMHRQVTPSLTAKQYRSFFDGNIHEFVKPNQHLYKDVDVPTKKYPYGKNFQYFIDHIDKVKMADNINKIIQGLEQKYSLFIISSTHSVVIKKILDKINLTDKFFNIYGSDVETSKVKKFAMILEEGRSNPKNSIFITDTLGDLKEAEKVGIKCLVAAWGFEYQSVENLKKGQYIAIIKDIKNLSKEINKYFSK